jgi:hypothetical protein
MSTHIRRAAAAVVALTAATAVMSLAPADAVKTPPRTPHRAESVAPLGPCKVDPDHIGGNACEISTCVVTVCPEAKGGVLVEIGNYNPWPVRVRTIYATAGGDMSDAVTVYTRVPAHDSATFKAPWNGAQTLYLQFRDEYNGRQLGSAFVDKP